MKELFEERIKALSTPLEPISTGISPRLDPLPAVKAVIFDVYGTLVISGSGDIGLTAARPKTAALDQALRRQGMVWKREQLQAGMDRFYEHIREDHQIRRQSGIEFPEVNILEIWERWAERAGLHPDIPRLAIEVECGLNPVWPMPGLVNCLASLRQKGVALGIVSNAQRFTPSIFPALTGKSLEELGIGAEHCIWSWEGKEAKPSPRLYERLLDTFAFEPEECLYVGNDMRNDIAPAAAVGMKTALFAGDQRSLRLREGDPLVGACLPDRVLTALEQIPALVQ